MSNYPNIYSISTVGVRQHDNADFLLHPIRTDFTGKNGTGKSIIADLMQLIFVPLKGEWKPGTEGIKKEDRKIETIPLERKWINHAYTFLNIEMKKEKYLTIGVYIPNNSRSPLKPFIIQKGEDFENRKKLIPFDRPLSYSDFISESEHILDLKDLQRHLHTNYNIYFKDFYQRAQIDDYFDLLFRNQIIPIDLTKESNLKSFAKILQSFSRAKTLDINKSPSLQNFLFEDNEEIKFTFEKEKENLSAYIREYKRSSDDINLWKKKQQRLEGLKQIHSDYEETKSDYLKNNALFTSNKYNTTKKAFEDNEKKHAVSFEKYLRAKKDYETKTIDLFKVLLEQKETCNEVRSRLDNEKADAKKGNIAQLKQELFQKKTLVEKLEQAKPLWDELKTIEQIRSKFREQETAREQGKKLSALKDLGLFKEFEKSKWTSDFKEAYDFYTTKKTDLKTQLHNLNALLELYEGNHPDSFFNWALSQKQALTLAQETVLMNFKDIYIKQVQATEGAKFTVKPKSLLNSLEEDSKGIWLKLGDIREFIPYIEKQVFDNAQKLEKAIEKDKQEVKNDIDKNEKELASIEQLHSQLQSIGYNQEFAETYQSRKQVEQFKFNPLLKEDTLSFIKEHFTDFENIKHLKAVNNAEDIRIDKLTSIQDVIKEKEKANNKILVETNKDLSDIKEELIKPSDVAHFNMKNIDIEKLEKHRTEFELEIKGAKSERSAVLRTKETQERTMNSANENKERLNEEMQVAEKTFKTAKSTLHEGTELQFDSLLPLRDLTAESTQALKEDYEQKEKDYESTFIKVAEAFEETKQEKKHPEIYLNDGRHNYSFQTLLNVLCGKLGLEGLTPELDRLNEKLKEFGDLQLKILINVFEQVEKQYNQYHNTIIRLNNFFSENKVNNRYKFKIEFVPRKDINIDWIERMKDKAKVQKLGPDLFTAESDYPGQENTPEMLIKNIAKTFYGSVDCAPNDLLNPKFYFRLQVRMEDEKGKTNAGSGGQAYTALALLCIGRLSVVQKQENRPGIRFIIIEELSNIDDTNFNIFPQIANEFRYQLLTMTPKPFGSYTNEDWYLHMLVEGKEPDRNYTTMSFFKNKYERIELNKHLETKNELEGIKTA
jgi:hypothetical protein